MLWRHTLAKTHYLKTHKSDACNTQRPHDETRRNRVASKKRYKGTQKYIAHNVQSSIGPMDRVVIKARGNAVHAPSHTSVR